MKLYISNRRIENFTNMWKLNDTAWTTNESKKKTKGNKKKILKQMKIETKTFVMQQKQF